MSYQVLSRKYRPQTFEEVKGQDHVVRALRNALINQQIGHAYLFTGTRGVGKTTLARILAKALSCPNLDEKKNPCNECSLCLEINQGTGLNVREIDGASHNGVEQIRQIIENVHYLPTEGKYKVVIIDEVHMLSVNAFNALLKTLEEPPAHVIFIFATTEPHKLIETVLSRCHRFDLVSMGFQEIKQQVEEIAQREGITFENKDLINQLAHEARGSLRDSLSLLEQVLIYSTDKKIQEEDFTAALRLAPTSLVWRIVRALIREDIADLNDAYSKLTKNNVSLKSIVTTLLDKAFYTIESIDSLDEGKTQGILLKKDLEHLNLAEAFWIFETLAKDTAWALESFYPEKVLLLILQKICLRQEVFGKQEKRRERKPQLESDEAPASKGLEAGPKEVQVEQKIEEKKSLSKNWKSFLEELFKVSPATASNFEQGNLVSFQKLGESLSIQVGFPEESKVFYEYLNNTEQKNKVVKHLAIYFDLSENDIELSIKLADISSVREERQEEERKQKEEKELTIEEHPLIKRAEQLFEAKVDKIVVDSGESLPGGH